VPDANLRQGRRLRHLRRIRALLLPQQRLAVLARLLFLLNIRVRHINVGHRRLRHRGLCHVWLLDVWAQDLRLEHMRFDNGRINNHRVHHRRIGNMHLQKGCFISILIMQSCGALRHARCASLNHSSAATASA
jgi:hypothetical protein